MKKTNRMISIILTILLVVGMLPMSVMNVFAASMTVNVEMPSGETVTLDVEPADSIENVKQKMQDKTGLKPETISLYFGDKLLEDGRPLADYNIQSGSTLKLTLLSPEDAGETYTLTMKYAITSSNGVEIGNEIADEQITNISLDTMMDLSDYWPEKMSVVGADGETYYFAGFVENSNGDGVLVYSWKIYGNKTLYAAWTFDSEISISFNTNGGTLDFKAIRYAKKFANIERMNRRFAPVRDGYKFLGWSLDDDGTADEPDIEITENCTLYAVWEEVHSHCVCGGNTNIGDHTTHTAVEFKAWDKTDSMPTEPGNYVLMNDVTISSGWKPAEGETVLCLNGYDLVYDGENTGSTIQFEQNRTLTLCDCKGTGKITHAEGSYGRGVNVGALNSLFIMYGGNICGNNARGHAGGGVQVALNMIMYGGTISDNVSNFQGGGVDIGFVGTLTMYGGTIESNSTSGSGGGVHVSGGDMEQGTFIMLGGSVTDNTAQKGGGVMLSAGDDYYANITVGGNAVIKNNTADAKPNNLYLHYSEVRQEQQFVTIQDMTDGTEIGITMDSGKEGIFSTGGKDYANNFFSDNGAYAVAVDGENLKLVEAYVQVGQVMLKNDEYTTDGENAVPGAPAGEGYAYFKDGVLTLNNFRYTGGGYNNNAIFSGHDLEIVVLGTNEIHSAEERGIGTHGNLEMYGGGKLIITTTSDEGWEWTACAIVVDGDAAIRNVTMDLQTGGYGVNCLNLLILDGVTADIHTEESYCLFGKTSLLITDSTLQLQSDTDICINSSMGDIEIANSTVTATGLVAISVNSEHNIKLVSGTYQLSGTHEDGAIYVWKSTLTLPEVGYWWRTDADGEFTKNNFVYNKQGYIEITTTDPHTCNYTYEANAYTITESCTCGHTATAEIVKDYDGTAIYNGSAYGAKVVYADNWAGDKVTELKYYKEQRIDENLVSECIDAGDYFAVLTVEGATAEWFFTISQKEPVISIKPTVSNIVVNSTLSDISLNGGTVLGIGDAELEGEFSWKEPTAVMDTVGSQTVKVVFTPEDENYSVKTFDFEVNVVNCDTADPNYKPDTTDSPQTGDNGNMALMYALLFVSGIGIVGTTIYGRKKRTNE